MHAEEHPIPLDMIDEHWHKLDTLVYVEESKEFLYIPKHIALKKLMITELRMREE